jgi:uncharacterized membrane protein YdfJ with MMPL/SSD domain
MPPVPLRTGPLARLALACYRHRRLTVAAWAVAVAALVASWVQFGAAGEDDFTLDGTAQHLMDEHFPRQSGDTLTLVVRAGSGVDTPEVRRRVDALVDAVARAPHVTSVASPYERPGQVSADRRVAFATVQFDEPASRWAPVEVTDLMAAARHASGGGVTFALSGEAVDRAETPGGGPSEGVGLLAAAVVLLLSFGSVVAAGLPILTALFGVGAGLSLLALLGNLVPAPTFTPILASMIGLGVGIDYALFVVTRYREGLRSGAEPRQAVVTAMATAGRAVLFAGTTVVLALLGLLVMRVRFLDGVAVGAACAVTATMLAALTLLPALLGFTGRGVDRFRVRLPRRSARGSRAGAGRGPAVRWAAAVQRRPAVAAALATGTLLLLAAPALGLRISMPDESTQARDTMGYQAYRALAGGFGPGFGAPLVVVAELPSPAADTAPLTDALAATPGVARVEPAVRSADGGAAMVVAYPTSGAQDQETIELVNRLRGDVLPAVADRTGVHAHVTGPNAATVDFADLVSRRLPWLVAVVVGVSVLLLTAVFRSVPVALKAAAMNLLSITAAYGVLVAVVQWGWLRQVFGFPTTMPVAAWVPLMMFPILFGLSMDYEVFLLSRIREEYDRHGDTTLAVARGLSRTARVITAAAAIMVTVFLSVVLGADVAVKQMGLGLAVAVLVDATVVRLVLVPSVMELLGRFNWWLPRPLARLLPPATAPRTGPVGPAEASEAAEPTAPVAAR